MEKKLEKKLKQVAVVILAVVILAGVAVWSTDISSPMNCREMTDGMRSMHTEEVALLNESGKMVVFQTRVADDDIERAAGYQHICANVIDSSAILFAWSKPLSTRFHMRNVKAPLDIGFFDAQGKLFSVMRMQPAGNDGDSELYGPSQPFQYALEARQGFFVERNLSTQRTRLLIGKLYDSG